MRAWVAENRNRTQICAINFLVRKIVETTKYDNKSEVKRNSKRIRNLLELREKLYWEGKPWQY